jgi:hypothetical protein
MIKKYWPSIAHVVTIGAGVAANFLSPSVQAWCRVPSHAAYAGAVLMVWGVILHHLPSPSQPR